jgi:hypothetical protein
MKRNLSEVVGEVNAVVQSIIENGGELTPELESQYDETNVELAGKVDTYGYVWERLESEELYWKTKADEFSRIAKSVKKHQSRLKSWMKFGMKKLAADKIEGSDFRFTLAKTSGRVVIHDESKIPAELLIETITYTPDKPTIKAVLTSGKEVPGCELIKEPSLRKYANRTSTKGNES